MNIFNYNGKIYKFLSKFWHLVWISFLWIICSLPIFTIGASSAAAYYAIVKNIRKNEDNSTRDFFKSFKQNFKQSVVMTVVYLIVGFLFFVAAGFYYNQSGSTALGLRWLFYILILIYLCTMSFAFAWLSRFEMNTFHAITYPIMITLMHLKESIGLIVFWAASIIFLYWTYNTFLFAILLLLIPGIKCLLDTYLIEPVMKKYEPIAEKNEKGPENGTDELKTDENAEESFENNESIEE